MIKSATPEPIATYIAGRIFLFSPILMESTPMGPGGIASRKPTKIPISKAVSKSTLINYVFHINIRKKIFFSNF
jgi:hypothetical protein